MAQSEETVQNLKARSVIKDVARTMGIATTDSQRIASLIGNSARQEPPDKKEAGRIAVDDGLLVSIVAEKCLFFWADFGDLRSDQEREFVTLLDNFAGQAER